MAAGRSFRPKPSSDATLKCSRTVNMRRLRREDPVVVAGQHARNVAAATQLRAAPAASPGQDDFRRAQPFQFGQQRGFAVDLGRREIAGGQIHAARGRRCCPPRQTAARKLFRSATSIRSSKCVPGLRICVTSRLTSLPGLASSIWSQMATLRPALRMRRDVAVGGVKRQAAHRDAAALGQGEVEQLRAGLRVLEEHLVEIAEPEQQQRVLGQFALDAAILRHHRRELGVGGHRRVHSNVGAVKRASELRRGSGQTVVLAASGESGRFARRLEVPLGEHQAKESLRQGNRRGEPRPSQNPSHAGCLTRRRR